MASGKSDYLEAVFLDLVLGGVDYTPPTTIYVALSTAAYSASASGSGLTEPGSGTGYARASVPNTADSWPAATSAGKSNGTTISFGAASSAWGEIRSFYLCDAATGGNVLYGGDLTSPRTIESGDIATFAVGTLTVTED